MALASRAFWGNRSKRSSSRPFAKKNFVARPRGDRPKTCYNCSNLNHYIAECPWENREDHNGKLVRKDKSKGNGNKNYVKKRVPNALCVQDRKVLEEYMSGDEDEDEVVATARIAIATPSSTPSSLFESPNENESIPYTCLMAKATSVTPSPKPIASTPPSLLDCVENVVKEPQSPNEVDVWLANLKGEDKVNVDALLEQLEETNSLVDQKEEIISGMANREVDYANEIADFSIALEKEQTRRRSLEEALSNSEESYAIDMSRVKKDHEHALATSKVYKNEKLELGIDHARLEKENKRLDEELKTLKESFAKLEKSHDQFLGQQVKEVIASTSNEIIAKSIICCEHANLVEENAKLKSQLEKGIMACAQGEKNLNDLLSNQKDQIGKEGLGFSTKSKKKNNKKKKSSPSSKAIIFVKEGELAKEKETNTIVGGEVTRDLPTHNDFAGKYNPSYVLMKSRDGHVYAKYVGSSYGDDYHWAIWVPKTLVTNKKGPIEKWVPKSKT
jgi:hypothetical protein